MGPVNNYILTYFTQNCLKYLENYNLHINSLRNITGASSLCSRLKPSVLPNLLLLPTNCGALCASAGYGGESGNSRQKKRGLFCTKCVVLSAAHPLFI